MVCLDFRFERKIIDSVVEVCQFVFIWAIPIVLVGTGTEKSCLNVAEL